MQTQKFPQSRPWAQSTPPANRPSWGRPSLFLEIREPVFKTFIRHFDAEDRAHQRRLLGLDDRTRHPDPRNMNITEPTAWRPHGSVLEPTTVYEWAMAVLNDKESVFGVVYSEDTRAEARKKRNNIVRYGFRITRHSEFVEGRHWDVGDIYDFRCGIIERYPMPLHARVTSVDVDSPADRSDENYFSRDACALASFELKYCGDNATEPNCQWLEVYNDPDSDEEPSALEKAPAAYVGTFMRDELFGSLAWRPLLQGLIFNERHQLDRKDAERLVEGSIKRVAEALDISGKESFGVIRTDRESINFWPAVFQVRQDRDLPGHMGFAPSTGLALINNDHLNVWETVRDFWDQHWVNYADTEVDLIKLLATMEYNYIVMVKKVRELMSAAATVSQ